MTSKVEYKLTPKQAKHIREVQDQIRNAEMQAWALEGQAQHNRRNADTMKRHLSTLLSEFLDLPKADTEYSLSPDGMALTAEVQMPEVKPNGMAHTS